MSITTTDEWRIHAGELPFADLLRLGVIDDDARKILDLPDSRFQRVAGRLVFGDDRPEVGNLFL